MYGWISAMIIINTYNQPKQQNLKNYTCTHITLQLLRQRDNIEEGVSHLAFSCEKESMRCGIIREYRKLNYKTRRPYKTQLARK